MPLLSLKQWMKAVHLKNAAKINTLSVNNGTNISTITKIKLY